MNWKKEVLSQLKPPEKEAEAIQNQISEFIKRLDKVTGDATTLLAGSGAKGTWLHGQHDADVFVLFPYKKYHKKSNQLSDILEKRIKKAFPKHTRLHGSRDYFHVKEDSFTFEIVPILNIKKSDQAKNITDVSPLHANWIKKHSTPKLRDEIRLAKSFAKAQDCYGAESYIRGISGHVLEILTIHYGSFEKLLKAASKWEEKQIIDAGKHFPKKENVWAMLNRAKLDSPLIVIDPVDSSRNAAAALNKEKWNLFKKQAASFTKKPNKSYFQKKPITKEKLKKKNHHLVWIELTTLNKKEDVAGAKLLLAFNFLKTELKDFTVKSAGWDWDREKHAILWIVVKSKLLPKTELRKGPPLKMKDHITAFKKKHKKTTTKQNHIWAKIPIKHYKLQDKLKHIMKEKYFNEKVSKIKKVEVLKKVEV
jgi:tRNA nucleotidyltransferase (CCA-adding enzyme)